MLDGIRVLDLSRVLAGPLCTMTLGDLGAKVIKAERTGLGDETRTWGPPFDDRGLSAYYLSVNRNKLSVAVDFDSAEDAALLRGLASTADVVVENFRAGVLDRRDLGPSTLLSGNPKLIWCTLTGFGEDSDRPGYDFVVQAESGWMAITGEPDGAPMKVGVALADVIAGKDAAIAVIAALAARERGTLGTSVRDRKLSVSLIHSATAALVNVAQNTLVSGNDARRWGNAHANLCPYELFETSDQPMVIAVGSDAQWRACVNAIGLPHLAGEPALATNPGRLANRERIVAEMSRALCAQPASHWTERLQRAGVPCGLVKSVREAVQSANGSATSGVPPLAPGRVRLEPPLLDQDGALVRTRGWDAFDGPTALPRREREH